MLSYTFDIVKRKMALPEIETPARNRRAGALPKPLLRQWNISQQEKW
jgi:hypothetical protein